MDFRGKRVAVIGTGASASAIQAVPKAHEMGVGQLLVFQRTPPWVIPRLDRRLHQWEKASVSTHSHSTKTIARGRLTQCESSPTMRVKRRILDKFSSHLHGTTHGA